MPAQLQLTPEAAGNAPLNRYCSVKCPCGETHGQYLGHYDRMKASCGRVYWVLQPKRNGPYKLRPWPGLPGLTLAQSIAMLSVIKS